MRTFLQYPWTEQYLLYLLSSSCLVVLLVADNADLSYGIADHAHSMNF